jgi:hypothetical protein
VPGSSYCRPTSRTAQCPTRATSVDVCGSDRGWVIDAGADPRHWGDAPRNQRAAQKCAEIVNPSQRSSRRDRFPRNRCNNQMGDRSLRMMTMPRPGDEKYASMLLWLWRPWQSLASCRRLDAARKGGNADHTSTK